MDEIDRLALVQFMGLVRRPPRLSSTRIPFKPRRETSPGDRPPRPEYDCFGGGFSMSRIEAIYEGGVFRPTQPVTLPEGTRVEVIVLPSETEGRRKTPAEIAAELAALADMAQDPGVPTRVGRDHDKYLYGWDKEEP